MSIVIPNVPLNTRVPGVYFGIDGSRAAQGLPGMPRRILLLGDKTSAGSAALLTPIRLLDADQGAALFGPGSSLASMAKAVRRHNGNTELWAMAATSGIDAAELTIQFTAGPVINYSLPSRGTAWNFNFNFFFGGSPIAVATTYTAPGSGTANSADFQAAAAAIGATIQTAIAAYATVSVTGDTITITAAPAAVGVWKVEHTVGMSDKPVLVVNGTAYNQAGGLISEFFEAAAGAASAAIGSITVVVSSPKAGTLSLYVAGVLLSIPVLASDTATALAARIATAINANSHLPVSASAALGVVTVTAKWGGTTGNAIDLRLNYYPDQATPGGVTITLSQPAGGSGIPDMDAVLAAIGDEWFTAIVCPWTEGSLLSAVESWLETRDGPMDPKPGHVFSALDANLAGLLSAGAARNSKQSTLLGCYGVPEPGYLWAAAQAAVCEYEASLDPARPLQQTRLQLLPPAPAQRFTRDERESLLQSGVSTFTVTTTGEVYQERVITTYRLSGLGISDVTWLDLETVNTVQYIRYAVRTRIASKFPRMKLADDGTQFGAGQPIVTPSVIRAEMIALFREFEEIGLVEDFDQFKADLQVVRSAQNRDWVNVLFPPDIINQLRVTAGSIQFRL